jgi:ADP-ribose pyrophosphatase YjhB (NUDIX family)
LWRITKYSWISTGIRIFGNSAEAETKDNESLIETAINRSKEEMGIDIEFLDENPFITFAEKETAKGKIDVILVHFLARRVGEISPVEDIRGWNWFDIDNLPPNLGPNIIPTLKHFGFVK